MAARKTLAPYGASVALWFLFGPLGAGALASGRWERALAECALWLGGLWMFRDGWDVLASEGGRGLARALIAGSLSPTLALGATLCLAVALGLWGGDFWRMASWHGRLADPLLDPRLERDEPPLP
jgi:hypothetical protein